MRSLVGILSFSVCFICVSDALVQPGNPASGGQTAISSTPPVHADLNFGRMPLYFIANQGQMDEQVAYYVQGKDKTLYFTPEGITIALTSARKNGGDLSSGEPKPFNGQKFPSENRRLVRDKLQREEIIDAPASERWAVKLDFIGANPEVKPIGLERTGAMISYFKGKPEEWRTGVATYSKVAYENLWPGIDLVYFGDVDRLKYEFVVQPGADPRLIRLAYRGAESLSVDGEGRLQVVTPSGTFEDDVPSAWQKVDGKRHEVAISYELEGDAAAQEHGFKVGEYDRSQTLILDPAIIVYCGFIGGSGDDYAHSAAVDSAGNAYISGVTHSAQDTFPVTVGPDLMYGGGDGDIFVAKVNPSGTALIYCGYIGGSDVDWSLWVAVDGAGNAYLTGGTYSSESTFPVTIGPGLNYQDSGDVFVAKVNPSGTALLYCGYIGGRSFEYGYGIAVDGSGSAYVIGVTFSYELEFPVKVGPDLTYNQELDAFVAKVDPSGAALIYCGYIGGSGHDYGYGIAVDGSGHAYVTGDTDSTQDTFPVMVGPDLRFNGGYDAFVAKVDSSGAGLLYCGYIGGSGGDTAPGIAVDSSGNAYVAGSTSSIESSFPIWEGPGLDFGGAADAFVAKVHPSGLTLVYCGYIGGSGVENGNAIAIDGSGNAYVVGDTSSTESTFPAKGGPDLTYNGGYGDIFVAKVSSSGLAFVYCGYIGGSGLEYGDGIAIDGSGNAYIAGETSSTESTFPVSGGPDLSYNGGDWDAFVAKISSKPNFTAASKNVSNSAGTSSLCPKIASIPGTDLLFAIWVEMSGDEDVLYFSSSDDGGKGWSWPMSMGSGQILGRVNDLEDNYAISLDVDKPYIHIAMQMRDSASGDFEIYYRRGTYPDGLWGGWIQLTNNTADSMHPDVSVKSGYVHIAYQDAWPGNNEIMYKRILNNGGGAVDQTRRLTFSAGNSCFPRIAVSKAGNTVHIVYQDDEPGQGQIFYRRIAGSGAGAYASRQLTSGAFWSGLPDITTSTGQDDQYVYIIYQALWPGNQEIMFKRLGSYGNVGGSVYTARLTYSTTESRSGAIFFDPLSNSVNVVYDDNKSGDYEVMYRNLANYGGGDFTSRRVSWGTGVSSHAALSGSNYLIYVIWSDNTSGNYEVLLKKSN